MVFAKEDVCGVFVNIDVSKVALKIYNKHASDAWTLFSPSGKHGGITAASLSEKMDILVDHRKTAPLIQWGIK